MTRLDQSLLNECRSASLDLAEISRTHFARIFCYLRARTIFRLATGVLANELEDIVTGDAFDRFPETGMATVALAAHVIVPRVFAKAAHA